MYPLNKATTLVSLQDELNRKVDPNWITNCNPFLRALAMETAEAIEHQGTWKWWKAPAPNKAQLQLEHVDNLHFLLSHVILQHGGDLDAAAKVFTQTPSSETIAFDGQVYHLPSMSPVGRLELQMGMACVRRYSIELFLMLVADADMTTDDLYNLFLGKQVMNHFRQENGYKEGTYQKQWHGREDNEHLVELMAGMDAQSETFQSDLFTKLSERYCTVVAA